MDDRYDVVVIGGGPAGLGGAVTLARAGRSVLVVGVAPADDRPPAGGSDRSTDPPAVGPDDVTGHGGHVTAATAGAVTRDEAGFVVTVDDGPTVTARRLLVTTDAAGEPPDVPGVAARWGRDVLHCPYRQGARVRDRRVGVLADGAHGVRQALLWRQWSPHVLLLRHHGPAPDPTGAEQLAARAVTVVDGPVTGLTVDDDRLTGVRLAGGDVVAVDALVVAPRPARVDPLAALGLTPGGRAGDVPGVWVVGDPVTVTAAAQGVTAAVAINTDLVAEDTHRAVDAYRRQLATMFERDAWEERYRSRPAVWSGQPNPQLVAEAADLPPGRALDAGCGEGADAVWLARRGWRVTAVDIATTALDRTAGHAAAAGVADRVTVRHADLRVGAVEAGAYDLVSAQFMHLPAPAWRDLLARLAGAVAPGGMLLVVGHHPLDLRTTARRMHFPDAMFTAEQAAGLLDPRRWQVSVAQTRPRVVVDPDGRDVTVHDAVLTARRSA